MLILQLITKLLAVIIKYAIFGFYRFLAITISNGFVLLIIIII